jgi:ribosome-binding factor A
MADINKRLAKGTFTNASTSLYTSPDVVNAKCYIKAITLCNKTATDATVTLLLAGTEVIYQHTIKAKDSITIPFLDQVLEQNEAVTGLASANTAINYYISGREVTP